MAVSIVLNLQNTEMVGIIVHLFQSPTRVNEKKNAGFLKEGVII